MNLAILIGRLTDEPKMNTDRNGNAIANYTLAVDRRGKENGADFIQCAAFGKSAEFAEKYFHKGMRVGVDGRIMTGSYTNNEGKKVYTTKVAVLNQEFADGKKEAATNDGFANADDDFVAPWDM